MPQTVLVIDNVAENRKVICTTIRQKLNFQIIEAEETTQLERYFSGSKIKKPDIVVFDISKSRDFCTHIAILRQINALIPILVLVQYADYDNAIKAVRAGAQDFLSKPIALQRLQTTLHNMIALRDARYQSSLMHHQNDYDNNIHLPLINKEGNIRTIEDIEKEAITLAIQHYNGHMTEVARRLGIGRSTLYRKIDDLGLQLVG